MVLFRRLFVSGALLLWLTIPCLAETGASFLAENAKSPEVTVTKSGLQYEVIKSGKGQSPGPTDRVFVHYRGTLVDGREFDSSYKRGKAATFQVNRVIPGWTEALQLMKEGDEWRLFIPSHLGYGSRGAGSLIGPNETLIFEVKLFRVQKTAR
jgi:FKBP-type peptidyl-prolyl cis-trans isomerase FklB